MDCNLLFNNILQILDAFVDARKHEVEPLAVTVGCLQPRHLLQGSPVY